MQDTTYWTRWNKRTSRRRALAVASAWSAAMLAACSGGGSKDDKSSGSALRSSTNLPGPGVATALPGEQPQRGGKYVFTAGAPANQNVYTHFTHGSAYHSVHVYDHYFLARYEKPIQMEAAESIEQPDPLTVVMKLKPGLKYQNLPPVNGRDVLAEDIVADKQYIKENPRAYQNTFERAVTDTVTATDARTVVFKLKAPSAYLMSSSLLGSATSSAIVPRESLPNLDTANPVGSGPFTYSTDTIPNSLYKYRRWDGWREAGQGLPYTDEREVRVLTDLSAIEAAFRSQQVDWWQQPPTSASKRLQNDLGARVKVGRFLPFTLNNFNTNPTRAPWTDIRVREALYRVINRKQALDLVEQGEGEFPYGILSRGLTEYQLTEAETTKYWKSDPQAARQLLQAAGFDFNKEYVFISNGGATSVSSQRAQVIAQQLAGVGIKTILRPMESVDWFPVIQTTGDFDLNTDPGPGFETPQQALRYHHTNTGFVVQFAGIKDPGLDALIEKQEQELDATARKKLVRDVQFAALELYTGCILTYTQYVYQVYQPYLRNFEVTPYFGLQPQQRRDLWIAPK